MNEEINKVEDESIEVFLKSLIDYAGLFPPARLPLDEAINNYISYKESADSWMLGTFIIPTGSLEDLELALTKLPSEVPLFLSVTGMKHDQFHDCVIGFDAELKKIACFRDRYGQKVQIEAFELPMPLAVPKLEELELLSEMAKTENLKLFTEVTIPDSHDWEAKLLETLDVFAAHNAAADHPLGVKLRTGGLEAKMFPSPEKVAVFIKGCAERKMPLKFTAGLHHPIRMYREEVQTKMHGFLNVFTAGIFAYAHNLEKATLVEILEDEQPVHFKFKDQELSWENVKVNAAEISRYRRLLFSYGSCSFDEPCDELKELNFLKEAYRC